MAAASGDGPASPLIRTSSNDLGPRSPSPDRAEPVSEAVPNEADGYDWQEEAASFDIADGMAALTIDPTGTGYLGSTAGVFFLRSLLLWLGTPRSPAPPQAHASPHEADPSLSSWRLTQSMLPHQVVSKLIDAYFNSYHLTYPFVHEATFRAQYHEIIPRPSRRAWQMLLNSVLALGAWCSNNSEADLEDHLYYCAVSFSEDETMFERASLTYVQALVLLSNLSQKRNKPNTGWNVLGLATRMAISLGLHRELPEWKISLLQRQMRRRVWWGLYLMDSGAATTFGRPILLPGREAMDVEYVLNIADEVSSW